MPVTLLWWVCGGAWGLCVIWLVANRREGAEFHVVETNSSLEGANGYSSYSSGQNKVNVRLACNDRATVIALERIGKKTENGNIFRWTRFLNFVLY